MTAALIALCPAADTRDGAIRLALMPDNHRLALYQLDDVLYATDDTCTRGAAALSDDGSLDGHVVECGWRLGSFDLRTGEACAMPALRRCAPGRSRSSMGRPVC